MITTDKVVSRDGKDKRFPVRSSLPRIVTTSWDDGDVCDFQIAEMLSARNLPATFYVPITGHPGNRALDGSELRALGCEGFEIGGHGFSHLILPQCKKAVIVEEVEASKRCLEDILGTPVRMFAYPRGRYSGMAIRSVKQAGYAGARTTEMLAQKFHNDPYKMPTTIHVFPHSKSTYIRNMARSIDLGKAWKYITQLRQVENWVDLAKILFDSTLEEGGIFHLWGHSWEVDELGLWNDLKEILDYVSNRDDVLYLSNGSIVDYATDEACLCLKNHCISEQA